MIFCKREGESCSIMIVILSSLENTHPTFIKKYDDCFVDSLLVVFSQIGENISEQILLYGACLEIFQSSKFKPTRRHYVASKRIYGEGLSQAQFFFILIWSLHFLSLDICSTFSLEMCNIISLQLPLLVLVLLPLFHLQNKISKP